MSDEKEKLRQKYKQEELNASSSSKQLPDAPPAYDDIQGQQNPYNNNNNYQPTPPQQPPQSQFGYNNQQYPPQQQYQQDPMQDPNVYKVQPNLVNINYSPPEHLQPQYQEFKQNQQQKMARGEFSASSSKPEINKGHTSKTTKIQSSFPGASGATYHNAANNR
ncbi:hypothetical protein KGF54_004651 [Candida jiufengensis]|uniref:uncharacterized protein n=1 Tax=Candida jiufengensis TaxID=497108 RepID=UPI0022240355|nr:uncharacterized protein KGF54_004651 [Candida jiufengensis]KAI5951577.1 hypothetical protein KGF54_004651 [Candida jiufengensis]